MIGVTSQRDACTSALADGLGCLRSLQEASGPPSCARPTRQLILQVDGTPAISRALAFLTGTRMLRMGYATAMLLI